MGQDDVQKEHKQPNLTRLMGRSGGRGRRGSSKEEGRTTNKVAR